MPRADPVGRRGSAIPADPDWQATETTRRPRILLGFGAALGLALALAAILEKRGGDAVPADAVAVVNGTPIRAVDLDRALGALAADRREPPSEAERRSVVDRLIEEELLVQRAKDLGIVDHDRTVRARLVSAMIEAIVAESARGEPTAEEVAAFYRDNAGFFAPVARAHVREIRIEAGQARSAEQAERVARDAAARLRSGEPFAVVARELGDPPIAPLPDGLVPAAKLRDYLGPSVTASALALSPGDVGDPIRAGSTWHVVEMIDREAGEAPPLATVEAQARAEMQRRRDDEALRAYLDRLREAATIRTAQ